MTEVSYSPAYAWLRSFTRSPQFFSHARSPIPFLHPLKLAGLSTASGRVLLADFVVLLRKDVR